MTDPASPRIGIFQTGLGGGHVYEEEIPAALAPRFRMESRSIDPVRGLGLPGRRLRQVAAACRDPGWDVSVRSYLPTAALGVRRARGRQVGLVHHLDTSQIRNRAASDALTLFFWRGLRRVQRLVVVSRYWRDFFVERLPGTPIDVVYNGFDVDAYRKTEAECAAFRASYGLDARPVIYLGNCLRAKGVEDAYEHLRRLPFQLVTSGRRDIELPFPHLQVDRADYAKLLAVADVTVAMSRFKEGWNRTAHESLLAGTPVVGLPAGGQEELLRDGGQILITRPEELPDAVRRALADADALVAQGQVFARRFTRERFRDSWIHVLEQELPSAAPKTPRTPGEPVP
jgi:glycosyltransferase involved in cell wall biosynthesis